MIGNPAAITLEEYGDSSWSLPVDHGFVRRLGSVPVGLNEAGRVALCFPISFVRKHKRWNILVPLLGQDKKSSLWLNEQQKLEARYIPFLIRMYPFTLVPAETGMALAVWQDKSCVGSGKHPFFKDGKTAPALTSLTPHFQQFARDLKEADLLINALFEADLLEQSETSKEQGPEVWNVNEDRLTSLNGTTLENLNSNGAIGLAYSQILSQHNKPLERKIQMDQATKPIADIADETFLSSIVGDMDEPLLDLGKRW